jgi:hypothetical protein
MKAVNAVLVRFTREGCEFEISYTADDGVKSAKGKGQNFDPTKSDPAPGSKSRTTTATRMASKALEAALQYLYKSERAELDVVWGGYATNTLESTDCILIDKKRKGAA